MAHAFAPTLMMALLLKMMLLPPHLLKSHAQGYADLASEVGARYLCALKNRWVLYGLSVLSLLLALIFGGVALLLWGALLLPNMPRVWILLALPVSCLMLSGLCGWLARRVHVQPLMKEIQAQIALDIQTLRQVKVT
jgi:hypothetical protein